MFAMGQSAGHFGYPMMILMAAAPLIGTIGAIVSYWKPLTGRTLMALSAVAWVALALLLVYVRWRDPDKEPLAATIALAIAGIVSTPALLSLLACWLTTRAAGLRQRA
jgi:hypothetical protein